MAENIQDNNYKYINEYEWHEKIATKCEYRKLHSDGEIFYKCTLTKNGCSMEVCPLNKINKN